MNIRLADRSRHRVGLTPAGQALLPKAYAVVVATPELRRSADAHRRQLDGRLVIGKGAGLGRAGLSGVGSAGVGRAVPEGVASAADFDP